MKNTIARGSHNFLMEPLIFVCLNGVKMNTHGLVLFNSETFQYGLMGILSFQAERGHG